MKTPLYAFEDYFKTHVDKSAPLPFETNVVDFKKKSSVIKPGEIEHNIYFLRSGIIQAGLHIAGGEERILNFFFPNHLFSSVSSFITQNPTKFNFTCLTNCTIEVISKKSIDAVLETSIPANKFMRHFLEYVYIMRITKETDSLSLTAAERYNKILEEQPELIRLFPVAKIAKYLGIHPNSLSRLRKF